MGCSCRDTVARTLSAVRVMIKQSCQEPTVAVISAIHGWFYITVPLRLAVLVSVGAGCPRSCPCPCRHVLTLDGLFLSCCLGGTQASNLPDIHAHGRIRHRVTACHSALQEFALVHSGPHVTHLPHGAQCGMELLDPSHLRGCGSPTNSINQCRSGQSAVSLSTQPCSRTRLALLAHVIMDHAFLRRSQLGPRWPEPRQLPQRDPDESPRRAYAYRQVLSVRTAAAIDGSARDAADGTAAAMAKAESKGCGRMLSWLVR
jgi:hypothetical protein